jgi:probable F420-dependent oxidoreductase
MEESMKLGVVFPQTEIGGDPGAVRAFAQAAEELGYDYLLAYDHVLGADSTVRPGWSGPYDHETNFHEPFVLFGYLAGLTQRIELVTGIIILPQRQTALVAKQAAEIDVLSGGRLRLGIGIGWNEVEYEALGENFHNRGKRSEEQIEVLRALWTQPVVNFEGRWHRIPNAGIKPLPVQRPIPIWLGGGRTDAVLNRIARLGDGWFPQLRPDDEGAALVERFRGFVAEAGREQADVGIDARVRASDGIDDAARSLEKWRELGASHVALNTMGAGFKSVDKHIEALREFKDAAGD